MTSVLIQPIDSIPNIDTTSFVSIDSLLNRIDSVTYEVSTPIPYNLPYDPLAVNSHLRGELVYTIIFMIVFAFIRLRGKNLFYNLFSILLNRKKTDIILTEGIFSNLVCYILSLSLSFSILSGCISFVICESFLTTYAFYAFISLFLYHFILLLIIHLVGWTFNSKNIAHEVAVNLWTYHIIMGLIVSPFVLSSFFIQNFALIPLFKIIIFSLALLLIVKLTRWVEILFTYRVSILYMILYLCAFEMIPLLVLYKIVV